MNKRLLFLTLIFSLIFTSVSFAQQCEVTRIKDVLRKNLYLYFTNPSSSPLTLNEVKDVMTFYLSISPSLIAVDCSVLGSSSNRPILDITNSGENAINVIPTCSDGTKYGECSTTKPRYCYGGSLLNKCSFCGCPSNNSCSANGNCNPTVGNTTCFSNLDCGTNQFTGNYYCSNNYITRNFVNYTCLNPGTVSSRCNVLSYPIALNYCNPSLNKVCIGGYANCQVTVVNQTITCSDGTQNNQCSATKPLYCLNGTLINNCSVCGCSGNQTCSNTGACVNQITNQTTLSPTGVCMVRDPYTSVPSFNASDVGIGYAKKAILGVNDLNGLKTACTNNTFYNVMQSYCTQNSNPMQQQLVTYSSTGSVQSSTCGVNGCSSYFCKYLDYSSPNSGVCIVSNAYTSISQIVYWDIDVGTGYAKMAKNGINTITGLQASCTKANYDTLVQSYCTQNSYPVQEGLVTYGPGGGLTSSSCGAFGCNYRNCSSTANQTQNSCFDSDNGITPNVYGFANGIQSGTFVNLSDTCIGSALQERYCVGNNITTTSVACAQCLNGACVNQTTTLNQTKPDLIVADMFFAPANPKISDVVYINITVKNIGTAASGTSILRVDGAGSYWRLNVDSLSLGSTYTWQISSSFSAGTYTFTATADVDNTNSESDENNNILSKNLTVTSATNQTNQSNNTKPSTVTLDSIDGTWCYDPDGYGSVNIYVKKYCQDNLGVHDDYCETSSLLRDWYCTGSWNGVSWSNVKCAAGGYGCNCVNGACV